MYQFFRTRKIVESYVDFTLTNSDPFDDRFDDTSSMVGWGQDIIVDLDLIDGSVEEASAHSGLNASNAQICQVVANFGGTFFSGVEHAIDIDVHGAGH